NLLIPHPHHLPSNIGMPPHHFSQAPHDTLLVPRIHSSRIRIPVHHQRLVWWALVWSSSVHFKSKVFVGDILPVRMKPLTNRFTPGYLQTAQLYFLTAGGNGG